MLTLLMANAAHAERPNVLFIAVDDLRPQLGAYGHDFMVTPHMDRLAATGRLFTRHYVQAPTCGASRYALITGQHPARGPSFNNGAFALYRQGHAPPLLPQWFREHGYHTTQMGKISHSPDGFNNDKTPEIPDAWDTFNTPAGQWETPWKAFFGYDEGKTRQPGRSAPFEAADVDDRGYPDGLIADAAVETLRELGKADKPFFFAVGFSSSLTCLSTHRKNTGIYMIAMRSISAMSIRCSGAAGSFSATTATRRTRLRTTPTTCANFVTATTPRRAMPMPRSAASSMRWMNWGWRRTPSSSCGGITVTTWANWATGASTRCTNIHCARRSSCARRA
jgi:hypothetical protein